MMAEEEWGTTLGRRRATGGIPASTRAPRRQTVSFSEDVLDYLLPGRSDSVLYVPERQARMLRRRERFVFL